MAVSCPACGEAAAPGGAVRSRYALIIGEDAANSHASADGVTPPAPCTFPPRCPPRSVCGAAGAGPASPQSVAPGRPRRGDRAVTDRLPVPGQIEPDDVG